MQERNSVRLDYELQKRLQDPKWHFFMQITVKLLIYSKLNCMN